MCKKARKVYKMTSNVFLKSVFEMVEMKIKKSFKKGIVVCFSVGVQEQLKEEEEEEEEGSVTKVHSKKHFYMKILCQVVTHNCFV